MESKFLEPEIHTLMDASAPIVRAADARKLVVNAPVPPAQLTGTYLGRYVQYGEKLGWHRGSTIAARSTSGPWYDLGLRHPNERGSIFWSKAHQYRHLALLNVDRLPANCNLYDLWAREEVDDGILWAILNSSVVAFSKQQFGRAAGIEGNLKTEVVDVNMMLVPDPRWADADLAKRIRQAGEALGARHSSRRLFEEFDEPARQNLDDLTLELLGVADESERAALRNRLYKEIARAQGATREREVAAQRDRAKSKRTGSASLADIVEELWHELGSNMPLQEFPRDFVLRPNQGEAVDILPGEATLGRAMLDTGRDLRIGTIRVGGSAGPILELGSPARASFVKHAVEAGRYGRLVVPGEPQAADAVEQLETYLARLRPVIQTAAASRTRDPRRQARLVEGVMRKAVAWTRPSG